MHLEQNLICADFVQLHASNEYASHCEDGRVKATPLFRGGIAADSCDGQLLGLIWILSTVRLLILLVVNSCGNNVKIKTLVARKL